MKLALIFCAVFGATLLTFGTVKMGAAVGSATKVQAQMREPRQPITIVRLHVLESGDFFCSGVVISKHLIATAAHCLAGAPEGQDIIDVRLKSDTTLGIHAAYAGANGRSDQALIKGDFSSLDTRDVVTDPQAINDIMMDQNHPLLACGYPYGGKLFCSKITNRSVLNFQYKASGLLYPGMSGGPVIDMLTGKVIAVNTAVDGDSVILSPLVELFAGLHVDPENNQ